MEKSGLSFLFYSFTDVMFYVHKPATPTKPMHT